MAAIIRSLRNGVSPVIGASRDDLVAGDVVTVNSVDTATTYSWSIAYKPPGSAAVFSGSPANATPGSFAVDVEGPYLVRLIVDLGLPTEDEQFVRLRYLTVFGDLRLVAAGEQYGPISIPVDAPFTGWADEQNYNLRTILGFVAKVSASGRLLYVDANTSTEGYGDYATIQAALNFAAATATATTPWVVAVRPGTYTEDLTLRPNVHVVAWPGSGSAFGNTNPVLVRGVHTLSLANAADVTVVGGMNLSVHLATTSPGLTKTGPGNLIVSDCRVSVDVSTPTQGPALRLDAGPMSVYGCSVVVAPANPITTVGLYQAGGTVLVHDTDVQAPTGIFVPPTAPVGTTTTVRYSRVTATGGAGATALRTDATSTTVQYSVLTAGVSPAVSVHPGGGAYAGAMTLDVQWSRVSGTVAFDTTGIVGASTLTTGAVTHGGFVFPGGSPTLTATVRSDSVFYDNTASGLTSADAQGAIDELVALLAPFTAGYTLGQAYNGGGPGAGRTIVADSGSVRILDGAFPSDPVPAGNTNGNLEVVGKVSVGALTKPEIDVDPNPYGTGPRISMGWTVVPNNSPTGVGMATVVGRSTEAPLYRNYDLRLGTMPASGGGKVGDVVVRAGDGTQGGATTPNPGSVYVLAGSGLDGTANRGNVILSPGVDAGGNPGAVVIADPRTATPASVTAAGVCSSPVGVTGTITFATDLGAATASINAVDTLAVVVAKLDALLGLSASSAAGIITVSSRTTGLSARVYFLSASAGLDAALGTFDGQSMTAGTYPDYIAIQTTASNEVTFGANGMTGPLVYNADTGKLTVPGLIDPTGMVFEEAAPPGTGATQGAVFVSDGTGGLTLGDLYYQGPGSAIPVTLAGGAGGSPTVTYVYRPGGVAAANVYTDFNLLYTAMSAVQGPKAILFDDTGLPPLAPINIPPKSGGGFYSFRNVSAYGIQLAPGSTSFPGPIVRFHNDGVNQAQCDSFFDYSRCIAWVSNALAGLPAVVLNDVNKHVVIADNCAFTATGAAEFFQVDGGGGFPVTFLDIILRRTSVVGAASRSFRAINAGSINVSAFDSPVGSDTLATDATSYISVAYDALTLPQATQPGCAAGTYDFTARAEHLGNQVRLRDVLPGSNTITLAVTGPNQITIGSGAANPMIYDAVTGKLTVPGVIDPTALILEAAATPATGATEGAIFVSDGTGGLASGSFYLRPPSNGTPLDLTGTVASGTDFYANVWPVWKKPCRVATTANVTSFAGSAPLTVDGVNVTTGDRVLVTVQTAGAGNGIYRVTVPGTGSDGTWVRDDDFNASSEVVAGLLVYVQEGSQNGRTRFTLVTTGTINLGVTALDFIQEAPLVRTDATSTAIIAAGTAFTAGTFIWSSAVDMRDYSEISVWFGPTNLGSNTQVDLYVQWSDDGSTIPFDNDNGIQQTDFLLATGSTGVFQPKDYVARLTTAGGELVVNAVKMLSFPKKGGSFRFGVVGNSATGTFGVRAQRLA